MDKRKLSNRQLLSLLEKEASKHGVKISMDKERLELEAPDNHQWGPELHVLVSCPWDGDTERALLFEGFKDLKNNARLIKKCPDDCPCKEKAE